MTNATEPVWVRLSERLQADCPTRVRVATDGEYFGLEGKVSLVYYDRLHTGSSFDLLEVTLDDGRFIKAAANHFEALAEGLVGHPLGSVNR